MDGEVPEYLAGGVSRDRDGSLRALDDYYLTHELLELLHHHGNAGSAGSSQQHGSFVVDEKPSLKLPAKEVAGEAEMASWLCQIFEQEASNPPITATTMTEGETTMRGSSGGGAASGHCRAASNSGTPADERPRSSSSRRRSGSGKAAEQRRRDKINDKMRTLQQLMPRCSKRDKASTLEEVIQYVKLLQHQLQVLSASGYAMPIVPPGAAPPSCMQRAAGDALGEPAPGPAPVILPPYPFVPAAVFACPYHGHSTPPPPQQQHCYPGGSGSATQQLAHGRRLASSDLAVPSHR